MSEKFKFIKALIGITGIIFLFIYLKNIQNSLDLSLQIMMSISGIFLLFVKKYKSLITIGNLYLTISLSGLIFSETWIGMYITVLCGAFGFYILTNGIDMKIKDNVKKN